MSLNSPSDLKIKHLGKLSALKSQKRHNLRSNFVFFGQCTAIVAKFLDLFEYFL